jgi:hypothetical protein
MAMPISILLISFYSFTDEREVKREHRPIDLLAIIHVWRNIIKMKLSALNLIINSSALREKYLGINGRK